MEKHIKLITLGSIFFLILAQVTARTCDFTSVYNGDANLPETKGILTCPGPSDPIDYTECCSNPMFVCCPKNAVVYKINNQLVRIVGLTVITSCVGLSVIILICCFWHSCPLYNTCREDYTLTDVVAYTKDDDSMNSDMPPDEKGRTRNYNVKIRPVEEV